MTRRSLALLARRTAERSIILASPGVGIYTHPPHRGEGLVPGSPAGTLTVLGRRIDLRVPADVEGRVEGIEFSGSAVAAAYGQPLLVLTAAAANPPPASARRRAASPRRPAGAARERGAGRAGRRGRSSPAKVEELGPDRHALRAPTTGVFYDRPDPSSPPFVTRGAALETGQTAGLIEVMKCFSPIIHPGDPVPSPAIVEEIRVAEGEEVHPGRILFVLRSA